MIEILTNREVIAINRDRLGKAGFRITKDGDREVWAKPLDKGAYAVALFNRGATETEISVKWSDLKLGGKLKVRDLWSHADRGSVADGFTAQVPSHGVVLIRLTR
jgi:alpha-galactosidase